MQGDTLNDLLDIYIKGPTLSLFVPIMQLNFGGRTVVRLHGCISNREKSTDHETKTQVIQSHHKRTKSLRNVQDLSCGTIRSTMIVSRTKLQDVFTLLPRTPVMDISNL